ncbi:hypothetical protein BC829DRAFT_360978 [Chytridium lagenaria]|nr:hypothetical protein BC829DRAFT_360978 [Chytridium lagenaria]
MADNDEDDYMSLTFLSTQTTTPTPRGPQTYSEKRKREIEQGKQKGTVKSLREREKEKRETGLSESLGEENKGFRLLAKMGFQVSRSFFYVMDWVWFFFFFVFIWVMVFSCFFGGR